MNSNTNSNAQMQIEKQSDEAHEQHTYTTQVFSANGTSLGTATYNTIFTRDRKANERVQLTNGDVWIKGVDGAQFQIVSASAPQGPGHDQDPTLKHYPTLVRYGPSLGYCMDKWMVSIVLSMEDNEVTQMTLEDLRWLENKNPADVDGFTCSGGLVISRARWAEIYNAATSLLRPFECQGLDVHALCKTPFVKLIFEAATRSTLNLCRDPPTKAMYREYITEQVTVRDGMPAIVSPRWLQDVAVMYMVEELKLRKPFVWPTAEQMSKINSPMYYFSKELDHLRNPDWRFKRHGLPTCYCLRTVPADVHPSGHTHLPLAATFVADERDEGVLDANGHAIEAGNVLVPVGAMAPPPPRPPPTMRFGPPFVWPPPAASPAPQVELRDMPADVLVGENKRRNDEGALAAAMYGGKRKRC